MKLIRYILSHGLLLGFLVILGFAYHYRVKLFSAEINQHVDQTVGVVISKARGVAEIFRADRKEQQVDATSHISPQPEPSVDTAKRPEQESETAPAPSENDVITTTKTEEQVVIAKKDEQLAPEVMVAPPVVKENIEIPKTEPEATVDSPSQDNDRSAAASSQQEMLGEARVAFQGGDFNKSVSLYQALGELNPGDPNIFGELGNVFYSQGKWKQAGEAYYEAASLLLDQGHTGQVQYLYRVIQGLDQESAEKLSAKMKN